MLGKAEDIDLAGIKGFRYFLSYRYGLDSSFSIGNYASHVRALKDAGASEIEHARRNLATNGQDMRMMECVQEIHDNGMRAGLYTGIFGSVDLSKNPDLAKFSQRDKKGNTLYFGKSQSMAMMCPESRYVDDIILPQIEKTLATAEFDYVFFDIPWIMKHGCYCKNCAPAKREGSDNSQIVRIALEDSVERLKSNFPGLSLGVNASAPGIYNHTFNGAHISNLDSLFDEYVTEWNPLRWGGHPGIITLCIDKARGMISTNPKFYHATTITRKNGDGKNRLYDTGTLRMLFSAILAGGATPRIGCGGDKNVVQKIGEAWKEAQEISLGKR